MRRLLHLSMFLSVANFAHAADSICYGKPESGRIERAVKLPASGKNFRAYSRLGVALGRTYTHSKVERATAEAYAALARDSSTKTYVYGEAGLAAGGPFEPHKTHQNGLSVDFMVPVMDGRGRSVPLPTSAANRFGYDIEFTGDARHKNLTIDFEAMADHLYALDRAARRSGVPINRVIFEPAFLQKLFATKRGPYLRRNLKFTRGKVWWRHDEHYHVDFAASCRKA